MNEDLLERFKRGKIARRGNQTQVEIRILPSKLNSKVREYYEPARKPSGAGPWLDHSEVPTSNELLDIGSDNSSSSDFVEIVPNKETGWWGSKGELARRALPA